MAKETLEERVEKLECKLQHAEERLAEQTGTAEPKKRGWRWFVGIYADSPDFDDVVRIGEAWRQKDRPRETDEA